MTDETPEKEPISWHRLLGLCLEDFYQGSDVVVDPEKDLSLKQQFVDLVILCPGEAKQPRRMPDGFETLGKHNLITLKASNDTVTSWVLRELIAHYVNYRKQVSPSMREEDLLAEENFRLYLLCVRRPVKLTQTVALTKIQEEVYEVVHFDDVLRVIVVNELPQQEHNAMLLLFSAREALVRYGMQHYRQHSPETSSFLMQLFNRYKTEDNPMAETLKQMAQRMRRDFYHTMTPEECSEFLRDLDDEDRINLVRLMTPKQLIGAIQGLPADLRADYMRAMPADLRAEFVRTMPAELGAELARLLTPEERLLTLSVEDFANLSPEVRAELLRRLQAGDKPAEPK